MLLDGSLFTRLALINYPRQLFDQPDPVAALTIVYGSKRNHGMILVMSPVLFTLCTRSFLCFYVVPFASLACTSTYEAEILSELRPSPGGLADVCRLLCNIFDICNEESMKVESNATRGGGRGRKQFARLDTCYCCFY